MGIHSILRLFAVSNVKHHRNTLHTFSCILFLFFLVASLFTCVSRVFCFICHQMSPMSPSFPFISHLLYKHSKTVCSHPWIWLPRWLGGPATSGRSPRYAPWQHSARLSSCYHLRWEEFSHQFKGTWSKISDFKWNWLILTCLGL